MDIFLLYFSLLATTSAYNNLFPDVSMVGEFKPVRVSSVCGIESTSTFCKTTSEKSCTLSRCAFGCCDTCNGRKPIHRRLTSKNILPGRIVSNDLPINRISNDTAVRFDNRYYILTESQTVSSIGLSLSFWMKQSKTNFGCPVIFDGVLIFCLGSNRVETYFYSPLYVETLYNVALMDAVWQHVALTLYQDELLLYLNGDFHRSLSLNRDFIEQTVSATFMIGSLSASSRSTEYFDGLLYDVRFYDQRLSDREVFEAAWNVLPEVYGYPYCRCPPSHPRTSPGHPLMCSSHFQVQSGPREVSRFNSTSYPPEYMMDSLLSYSWISEIVEEAKIDIDLDVGTIMVLWLGIGFNNYYPRGVKLEKSIDGSTYTPWQFFADDCRAVFNMTNNDILLQPDQFYCSEYNRPNGPNEFLRYYFNESRRLPDKGCQELDCSPTLMEFVQASRIRISLYGHPDSLQPSQRYFGVNRVIVAGYCDCFGHSKTCKMLPAQSTSPSRNYCECDPSTYTTGTNCERCLPLFQNKPFKRGTTREAFPCKECRCNNHASACRYDPLLDPDPEDRDGPGGGVCTGCQHNTMGRYCDQCLDLYYRPQGKPLDAVDVCAPCGCSGPGLVPGFIGCVKDDSDPALKPGQCRCKDRVVGRLCDKCADGFYDLSVANPDGCSLCGCMTSGTVNGSFTCDMNTGQCYCKDNVDGYKCNTCKKGYYGLSSSNPLGCFSCGCDPIGSTSAECMKDTGQCPCKPGIKGNTCSKCSSGYFNLTSSGCTKCSCEGLGVLDGSCDPNTGQCFCKRNVQSDGRCRDCNPDYFGLSGSNPDGCNPCGCRGPGVRFPYCNQFTGKCICKDLTEGLRCQLCQIGSYNLSGDNPTGCQPCYCNPKGSRNEGTTITGLLPCDSTSGQCSCLDNVSGQRCDTCVSGYYWNPIGPGCVSCDCNNDGSTSATCSQSGGICTCRESSGFGGPKCDSCIEGYYRVSKSECRPCQCDSRGSINSSCDLRGQCTSCKQNTQGVKCDECKPGYIALEISNDYGCSGVPSRLPPPTVIPLSPRKLKIIWSPPERPNGTITGYQLYKFNRRIFIGLRREFIDDQLLPYTAYNYWVIASTIAGSTESILKDSLYYTLEDAPENVSPPVVVSALARSVSLSWKAPESPNGILRNYSIVVKMGPVSYVFIMNLSLEGVIPGLRPYTSYLMSLVVCSGGGCTQSESIGVDTAPSAPDEQPPPTCTALPGGRSVMLRWDEPPSPNGVILLYEVYFRKAMDNGPGDIAGVQLGSSNRTLVVANLTPYTQYLFRVVVYTLSQNNTSSSWVSVETTEDAPSGASAMQPVATNINSTSAVLTWNPPSSPNGFIKEYLISITTSAGLYSSEVVSNGLLSTLLRNLLPYRQYNVFVRACNSIGCTTGSRPAVFNTTAGAPEGQNPPKFVPLNDSSVQVHWEKPLELNGPDDLEYRLTRFQLSPPILSSKLEKGLTFTGFTSYVNNNLAGSNTLSNTLHVEFKTMHQEGFLLGLFSVETGEMLALQIIKGQLQFVLDINGFKGMVLLNLPQVENNQWYSVTAVRDRREIRIHLGNRSQTDFISGGSIVLGPLKLLYVGKIPPSSPLGSTVTSRLTQVGFAGCLRGLSLDGIDLNMTRSHFPLMSTEVMLNVCFLEPESGFRFSGGGYALLGASFFPGGLTQTVTLQFRSLSKAQSVLLAGIESNQVSWMFLLDQFRLSVVVSLFPSKKTLSVNSTSALCDGQWHTMSMRIQGGLAELKLDSRSEFETGIQLWTDQLFVGGLEEYSLVPSLPDQQELLGFSGCLRIMELNSIVVGSHASFLRASGVSAAGCLANKPQLCSFFPASSWTTVSNDFIDSSLRPFTDFLYRVESIRKGLASSARSPLSNYFCGEGAPERISAPSIVNTSARSVIALWTPPLEPNGILTSYRLVAYNQTGGRIEGQPLPISFQSATLDHLQPYTFYSLVLRVSTRTQSAESPMTLFCTQESEPENVEIARVQATESTLNISWSEPRKPNGRILSYRVLVDGIKYDVNLSTFFYLPGLAPYRQYAIQLEACTTSGCALSAIRLEYSLEAPPSPVEGLTIEFLGAKFARLVWNPPRLPNGLLLCYEVSLVLSSNPSTFLPTTYVNASTTQCTLEGLMAFTSYYVAVVACNSAGCSKITTLTLRTAESSPEEIPAPYVVAVSSSELFVAARLPLKPNGIIIQTSILFSNNVTVQCTNVTNCTITALQPYTLYKIFAVFSTSKGSGLSNITEIYTLEAPPNGYIKLNLRSVSSRSAELCWNLVEQPNGRLNYSLIIDGPFQLDTGRAIKRNTYTPLPQSCYAVQDLLPYSEYNCSIIATNTQGAVFSTPVVFVSSQGPPEDVIVPSVVGVTSTSIFLTWIKPKYPNGILLYYRILITCGKQLIFSYDNLTFSAEISSIKPYTVYCIQLEASTTAGSNVSSFFNTTTLEADPEGLQVPKAVLLTSRTMLLSWMVPERPNGLVNSYSLLLDGIIIAEGLLFNSTIRGLMPFTVYNVSIKACNSVGCAYSWTTLRTLQDAPQGLSPPFVNITGPRSANICLVSPSQPNGIIVRTVVHRTSSAGHVLLLDSLGVYNSCFTDNQLLPYRNYTYTLSVSTSEGTSNTSSMVETLEDLPEGVPQVSILTIGDISVNVSFALPMQPNGPLVNISIVCNSLRFSLDLTSNSRSLLITGLTPYSNYSIYLHVCNRIGCSRCPDISFQTLEAPPSGLAAPETLAISVDSISVNWALPVRPNGMILEYQLFRMTLNDPASDNSTSTVLQLWVLVYRGLRNSYTDVGLGVFSLQKYYVAVSNSKGSTNSESSIPLRTKPGVPRQGPVLSIIVKGPVSALMTWPELSVGQILGEPVSYDVFYKWSQWTGRRIEGIKLNSTQYLLENLLPSTSYTAQLFLFNGNSTVASNSVDFTTKDGAPENFLDITAEPSNSSSLLISWIPPLQPNGIITKYTIICNGTRLLTVSGNQTSALQTGLLPYRVYVVEVEACTSYACTRSRPATVSTLPAAPKDLDPPVLVNKTSRSLFITWNYPRSPNGIIERFQLYRRSYVPCNSSNLIPNCRYLECKFYESRTGDKCYNSYSKIACGETIHDLDPTKTCCDNNYLRRTQVDDICCGGVFYTRSPNHQCCAGYYVRVPKGFTCCASSQGPIIKEGDSCCRGIPYNSSAKECLCGGLYERLITPRQCCGGKLVSVMDQCCGDEALGRSYPKETHLQCCGTDYVDPSLTLCCKNNADQTKLYTYNSTEKKLAYGHSCCGLNRILVNESCCGDKGYNSSSYKCADVSMDSGGGCGVGVTCPRDFKSPYCDRCDFSSESNICYTIPFLYIKSITTDQKSLCPSPFKALGMSELNPVETTYMDISLEPFSSYDYYLEVWNRVGSAVSSTTRFVTDYGTPEGLSPPVVVVLSSSAMAVSWLLPTSPNSQTVLYQLYRKQSSESVMVYCGYQMSYMDSNLTPYTGYRYTLRACSFVSNNSDGVEPCKIGSSQSSLLCSSVQSDLTFTEERAPSGVQAPNLYPTSPYSVLVNWTSPSEPNGRILEYEVNQVLKNGSRVMIFTRLDPSSILAYTVSGLQPFTDYQFCVVACTAAGCSSGPVRSVTTLEAPPSGWGPVNVLALNSSSVLITWTQPSTPNGIISVYKVFRNETLVLSTTSRTFTDTGLSPATGYVYQVAGCTTGGCSYSSPVYSFTEESSPEYVIPPTVLSVNSTSVNVTWSAPLKPNGEITSYSVLYSLGGDGSWTVIPVGKVQSSVITSLQPFSEYLFKLKASTAKGSGLSESVTFRTGESPPEYISPPSLSVPTPFMVDIVWVPPLKPNGLITSYHVERRSGQFPPLIVYLGSPTKLEYIDTGLLPYTTYQYRVVAVNSQGQVSSDWASVMTSESASSSVQRMVISPLAISSETEPAMLQVSWEPPAELNGILRNYKVLYGEYESSVSSILLPVTTLSVVVTSLKPATNYQLCVVAVNGGGESACMWNNAKTSDGFPLQIQLLNITASGRAVNIIWNPPAIPNGVITAYKVYRNGTTVCEVVNPPLSCTVVNNAPNTVFNFQLSACTSAGCAWSDQYLFRTPEESPIWGQSPSTGTVNASLVVISWEPLDSSSTTILEYNVIRKLSTNRSKRDNSPVVVCVVPTSASPLQCADRTIIPGSRYVYTVCAITRVGDSCSADIAIAIPEAAPVGIAAPVLTLLDDGTVSVSWSVPASPNGVIVQYSLIRNGTILFSDLGYSYVDASVLSQVLYSYSIKACTMAGCNSGPSSVIYISTLSSASVLPPRVQAMSSSDLNVTWSAPSSLNLPVVAYKLYIDSRSAPVYTGLETEFIIRGLQPFTQYSIVLTVCVRSCVNSKTTMGVTLEAAPEGVPSPSISVLGPNMLMVSWIIPQKPNGVLITYGLFRDAIRVYSGPSLSFLDTNLSPGLTYQYKLCAATLGGETCSPPVQSPATLPGIPGDLPSPMLTLLDVSTVLVDWSPPLKPNGVITDYHVFYEVPGQVPQMSFAAGLRTSWTLTNLLYFTVYFVHVRCCNRAGCANSLRSNITTGEGVPSQIAAPIVDLSAITARSLKLIWYRPLKPNGQLLYYVLRRDSSGKIPVVIYNGTLSSFTDQGLRPYTLYQYSVEFFNSAGSVQSGLVAASTGIGPPEGIYPPIVRPGDISSGSLGVLLPAPQFPNAPSVWYELYVNNTLVDNTTNSYSTVISLNPFTFYSLAMSVCNPAGCNNSIPVSVQTSEGVPYGFGPPLAKATLSIGLDLSWEPPSSPNGIILGYNVSLQLKCPQRSLPGGLCVPQSSLKSVGLALAFSAINLKPDVMYTIQIFAFNKVGTVASPLTEAYTVAKDPEVRETPLVRSQGFSASIDWTGCFWPNGQVLQFVVEENNYVVFTGTGLVLQRPNLQAGGYTYIVRIETLVSGSLRTASTKPVSVQVDGSSAFTGVVEKKWYEQVWFIVVICVLGLIIVGTVLILLLKKKRRQGMEKLISMSTLPSDPKDGNQTNTYYYPETKSVHSAATSRVSGSHAFQDRQDEKPISYSKHRDMDSGLYDVDEDAHYVDPGSRFGSIRFPDTRL